MKKLLFNPYERYAGAASLLIGTIIVAFTALLAFLARIHLDGVMDLHVNGNVTPRGCLAEGMINWLSMVVFIYVAGLIFSKSSIRFVDVLGTQGMARFPMLVACIFSWLLFNDKVEGFIRATYMHQGEPVTLSVMDWLLFGLDALIVLACAIWMIVLMFRAYSVACNIKGTKAVLSFSACLLLAEILSKVVLNSFI